MRPFLLPLLLILPTATPAQDDFSQFEWIISEFEPFEPSDLGLALFYGVPQSDHIIASGHCMTPGDGTTTIRMNLSASPAGLVEFQSVTVEFDGVSGTISGSAFGIGAEMGITGVMIEEPSSHPLWSHLAQTDSFTYRITGQEDWVSYPSAPVVADFITQCITRLGAPAPAATIDTVDVAGTCNSTLPRISTEDGAETSMRLENSSGGDVLAYWFDATGTQTLIGTLPDGEIADLGTRDSHTWMFTNAAGTCLQIHPGSVSPILFEPRGAPAATTVLQPADTK